MVTRVITIRKTMVLQLLIINIVAFILQQLIPTFTDTFALISSEVLARPWTLLSAMFLHGSFTHLLFNMYALLIFGPLIERKVGRQRFIYLYFIAGLLASVAALAYPAALGASGAIMGILGAVIMLYPKMKVLFFFVIPMSMRNAGIIFALFDLFGAFSSTSNVAHLAHLAGLVVGLLFGWYVLHNAKKFKKSFTARASAFTNNSAQTHAKASTRKTSGSYEDTIELTKSDLDNFYKHGKL